MLPYDGITRTGSKGVSHFAAQQTKTPSELRNLLEKLEKSNPGCVVVLSMAGCVAILPPIITKYTGMEIKMQNMEQARFNMIEQQIRPCDVLEARILELLHHVRREQFVPEGKKAMAFMDMEIPLGSGVSMWQPKLEARALQELHLGRGDKVLEVGTGSGYLTALLSTLAGHVTSVEIVPELSAMAKAHLQPLHRENITLEVGDASLGWGDGAKYDAIVLTGSTPVLPESLQNSLNVGGRMFVIVGEAPVMVAKLITRVATDTYETTNIMETSVAALQNAPQPKRFVF
jgi:protein-L-isoaspartate(D-aspartate) O-methyltransferase